MVWFVLWVLSFWKCVCLCLSLFGREEWDSLCCVGVFLGEGGREETRSVRVCVFLAGRGRWGRGTEEGEGWRRVGCVFFVF